MKIDRGGEFTSSAIQKYCEKEGILRELTASYTPEQNIIVERKESYHCGNGTQYDEGEVNTRLSIGGGSSNINIFDQLSSYKPYAR